MKYAFIDSHRQNYPVTVLCAALAVDKSAYYAFHKRGISTQKKANIALLKEIRTVHKASHYTYGSPRVTAALKAQGVNCSENRVARLMRAYDLRSKTARKFKVTTHSKHSLPVAPNLLNQNFNVAAPNRAWVSDITYIYTRERWLYLAVIIDLFSRKVVGWATSTNIDANLVITALKNALANRRVKPGLIFHSDQGKQYASNAFRALLEANKIKQSMSRKGNCYDNAVCESFFKTLKTELIYPYDNIESIRIAKRSLFYYINFFYNSIRIHSTLGYKSPREFEQINRAA